MTTLLSILYFFSISTIAAENIHSLAIKSPNDKTISLSQYKDHTLLVVNIATRCGFTKQLKSLENIYQKYKNKKFVILGVPSNDFASQTPESNSAVAKFCKLNYGVTFPLTEKVVVKGPKKHPLLHYLVDASGGQEIGWNFEKFLIGPKGKFIARYASSINPESKQITNQIENQVK